ncbi:ATP-binding protein [Streptomyces sp. NPDC006516]|uniref:ATP-binding protein n=1 Tax=Streptomyces sp. NPDC006516 TaxID=3154309 RepID=UPI0033BC2896
MSLSQQRRFARRKTSVRASRDFVTDVLTEWRLTPLIEDMRLCVSELATNALLHGAPPGREFAVQLSTTDDLVRLEVRDSGDGTPVCRQPDSASCSGRGLHIAHQLAAELGVRHHTVGKTVWAVFKKPSTPQPS